MGAGCKDYKRDLYVPLDPNTRLFWKQSYWTRSAATRNLKLCQNASVVHPQALIENLLILCRILASGKQTGPDNQMDAFSMLRKLPGELNCSTNHGAPFGSFPEPAKNGFSKPLNSPSSKTDDPPTPRSSREGPVTSEMPPCWVSSQGPPETLSQLERTSSGIESTLDKWMPTSLPLSSGSSVYSADRRGIGFAPNWPSKAEDFDDFSEGVQGLHHLPPGPPLPRYLPPECPPEVATNLWLAAGTTFNSGGSPENSALPVRPFCELGRPLRELGVIFQASSPPFSSFQPAPGGAPKRGPQKHLLDWTEDHLLHALVPNLVPNALLQGRCSTQSCSSFLNSPRGSGTGVGPVADAGSSSVCRTSGAPGVPSSLLDLFPPAPALPAPAPPGRASGRSLVITPAFPYPPDPGPEPDPAPEPYPGAEPYPSSEPGSGTEPEPDLLESQTLEAAALGDLLALHSPPPAPQAGSRGEAGCGGEGGSGGEDTGKEGLLDPWGLGLLPEELPMEAEADQQVRGLPLILQYRPVPVLPCVKSCRVCLEEESCAVMTGQLTK